MNSFHVLPPRPGDDPRDHELVVCVKRLGFGCDRKFEMRTTAIKLDEAVRTSDQAVRDLMPNGMDDLARHVYWYTLFELQSHLIMNKIYPWGGEV